MYSGLIDGQLEEALFECFAQQGIDAVTIDDVARRLGRSRAALYRQFGTWPQLLACAHGQLVELIDQQSPGRGDDRRLQFEQWWSSTIEFFATPHGRGFLGLRLLAARRIGLHALEDEELARLPSLSKWMGSSALVARTAWLLVLSATHPALDDAGRGQLREIIWSIIAPERFTPAADDELDFSAAQALGALL